LFLSAAFLHEQLSVSSFNYYSFTLLLISLQPLFKMVKAKINKISKTADHD